EPYYVDSEIAALGLNTARGLIWKGGRIDVRQIARIRHHFDRAPVGASRVLVTHHPFDLPEHYGTRHLVGRAQLAMHTIADCGIDLMLAGHFHLGHSGHTAMRYKAHGHSAIFVQSGTLSTRERGEPASFNAIRIDTPAGQSRRIEIDRYWWNLDAREFV